MAPAYQNEVRREKKFDGHGIHGRTRKKIINSKKTFGVVDAGLKINHQSSCSDRRVP
jgi:hypothetical protein